MRWANVRWANVRWVNVRWANVRWAIFRWAIDRWAKVRAPARVVVQHFRTAPRHLRNWRQTICEVTLADHDSVKADRKAVYRDAAVEGYTSGDSRCDVAANARRF